MEQNENFCLRLNEFENNVKLFWKDLQIEKDFCDVILASEGKQIKTHKIVISSCSPVFKNILKYNEHSQPLIYLRKVKHKDLQNLVTFMYQGEVNIAEEDLSSFLEAAEDLQIKVLSEINIENLNLKEDEYELYQYLPKSELKIRVLSEINVESLNSKQDEGKLYHHLPAISPKRKQGMDIGSNNLGEPNSIRPLSKNSQANGTPNFQASTQKQNKTVRNIKKEDNEQSLVVTTERRPLTSERVKHFCDQCNYKAKRKSSMKLHIESVHLKISVNCNKCFKTFSNNLNLRKHNMSIHEGVRYPCEYCDHKATQSGHLKIHILKHHTNKLNSDNEEDNKQSFGIRKLTSGGVNHFCEQCNYKAKRKSSMKLHIESVHLKISVNCTKCFKTFSNNLNLRKHNMSIHEGVCYPCEYCGHKATQSGHLKIHILKHHKNKLNKLSEQWLTPDSSLSTTEHF